MTLYINQKYLLSLKALLIIKNETIENNWLIGNIQHSGFYRVNYDLENWNKLIKQLKENHTLINPINRAQLIDDSFNLGIIV